MSDALIQPSIEYPANDTSYIHHLFDKAEQILLKHRLEDPAIYKIVEEKKILEAQKASKNRMADKLSIPVQIENKNKTATPTLAESIYFKQAKQAQLKLAIATHQKQIHQHVLETQSHIVPRTQARNIKQPEGSIEAMTADRADKLEAQVRAWRSILPVLIRRFAKIRDPRRAKSVKHQLATVMLYGLFAFIFRLSSRREMNRELTSIVLFENLKKLFPELESIPHADTLTRVLEKINVNEIERTHVELINQLIRNKKFKKLYISGCLPIAMDGTQKL